MAATVSSPTRRILITPPAPLFVNLYFSEAVLLPLPLAESVNTAVSGRSSPATIERLDVSVPSLSTVKLYGDEEL